MRLLKRPGQLGMLLCCLSVLAMVGCTGPLRSRIFPQTTAAASSPQPHYVSGQLPLPSHQAVQPAAVSMPASGGYDAQTMQDVRTRRGSGFGSSSRGSNCFS